MGKTFKNLQRSVAKSWLLSQADTIHLSRNYLVRKKYKIGLSPIDRLLLWYRRWQLDLLEDAMNGSYLDQLEEDVQRVERLAQRFQQHLKE